MTAAAASLYVAQPALSRAVRALEHELGVTVFARSGRGVRLTAAGEVVVARARRVLRSLDTLHQARDAGERNAPFTIAASPTLQAALAIPILRALADHGLETSCRLLGAGGTTAVHELRAIRARRPRHLRPGHRDRSRGDPGRPGRGAVRLPGRARAARPDAARRTSPGCRWCCRRWVRTGARPSTRSSRRSASSRSSPSRATSAACGWRPSCTAWRRASGTAWTRAGSRPATSAFPASSRRCGRSCRWSTATRTGRPTRDSTWSAGSPSWCPAGRLRAF